MVIDELELLDGFFDNDRFILRGILGHAVFGNYNLEGLLSFSRLIQEGEPLRLIIDDDLSIPVPIELNIQLKKELEMLTYYLKTSE